MAHMGGEQCRQGGVERETGAQGRSAPAVCAEATCAAVYGVCEQLEGRCAPPADEDTL